ncbi:MAG TPA: HXXEE domain-containing protein [Candidatus Acidoferrum sp.]|nr:HXXEE domain-containing protein [Candidatus Acidoferrum sp.]
MTFRYLQLLFPVLVALHNTEEAIGMPRWTRRSGPWFGGVQPAVFRFAVVVFTVLAFAITVLSTLSGRITFWGNVTFGYIVAMLLNSLVPHIAVSVAKRTLMPGVITAATLNLPILSFLAALALKQGYVSNHDALVFSIAVPLLLLLMILLLFKLGRFLGL